MKHTFSNVMTVTLAVARMQLLELYEQLDMLQCEERPRLEQEYMEKAGEFEQAVIREEMECQVLRKKQQLLQAALNRREKIDLDAIEEQTEQFRRELMAEALGEQPEEDTASGKEREELEQLYQELKERFSPRTHPELSPAQKELFDRAREAYRRRDLTALALAGWLLCLEDELLQATMEHRHDLSEYDLTAAISTCFVRSPAQEKLVEDMVACRDTSTETEKRIAAIKADFPFSAKAMLSSPGETAAYRRELERRLEAARAERERREKEIRETLAKEGIYAT